MHFLNVTQTLQTSFGKNIGKIKKMTFAHREVNRTKTKRLFKSRKVLVVIGEELHANSTPFRVTRNVAIILHHPILHPQLSPDFDRMRSDGCALLKQRACSMFHIQATSS